MVGELTRSSLLCDRTARHRFPCGNYRSILANAYCYVGISGNSHKTVAVVAMKRKAKVVPVPMPNVKSMSSNGCPGREGSTLQRSLFYFTPHQRISTPALAHPLLPNTIMHVHHYSQPLVHVQQEDPIKHRSLSFPRTREEEPSLVPKRSSRKVETVESGRGKTRNIRRDTRQG